MNIKKLHKIKNICLDSAYATPAITREIILNEQTPLMPYVRPKTKKGFFKISKMFIELFQTFQNILRKKKKFMKKFLKNVYLNMVQLDAWLVQN